MRIRWSHILQITRALEAIMQEGRYADAVVKEHIKSPKMGSKDRRLVATSIYDIVKNYRFYSWLAESGGGDPKSLMHIQSVYYCLSGIDAGHIENWLIIDPEELSELLTQSDISPQVRYSMPDWIHEKMKHLEQWSEVMKTLAEQAPVFIRVNLLRAEVEDVTKYFTKVGYKYEVCNEAGCIKLFDKYNLLQDPMYLDGKFEIQDGGSQEISLFMAPTPGAIVFDMCAGGGGKTLHLAVLMQNKGRIIAFDTSQDAIRSLLGRKERAGVKIVDAHTYEQINLDHYDSLADQILCDVPCSGSGVFRREVDKKWKLTQLGLAQLTEVQREILENAAPILKPGGELVYATCSIFPDENETQINQFLAAHPKFTLLEAKTIWPQSGGTDGFYMAKLKKTTA